MTRARASIVALVVLLSVTGVTLTPGTAIAQESGDSSGLEGVLADSGESRLSLDAIVSGIGGAQDRAYWWFQKNAIPEFVKERYPSLSPDLPTATEEAESLSSYYNEHNATIEAYVNDRRDVSENHTVEITLHFDGETETRYLEVNSTNNSITNTKMVKTTNRSVDHTADLCHFAAESATEELRYFVENYAEPDKDVSTGYLGRLKGRYNKDVETTLYPSNGECGS